jgi:hypothetical protein
MTKRALHHLNQMMNHLCVDGASERKQHPVMARSFPSGRSQSLLKHGHQRGLPFGRVHFLAIFDERGIMRYEKNNASYKNVACSPNLIGHILPLFFNTHNQHVGE